MTDNVLLRLLLIPGRLFITEDQPHLTLHKSQALEHRSGRTRNGQSVRPARVIGDGLHKVVPDLSIPIQGAVSVAVETDISAPEYPRSRLVLVSHRKGMVQPVGDIGSPLF